MGKKNEIIIFINQNVKLEVNMQDEMVVNALKEELDYSTVANFATVKKEGNKNVTRSIEYYQ